MDNYRENLKNSNKYIIELIKNMNNKPFLVGRLGTEAVYSLLYHISNELVIPLSLMNNAGIYIKHKEKLENESVEKMIKQYYTEYYNSILSCDAIGIFKTIPIIQKTEEYIINNLHIKDLSSRSLEPFYAIIENEIPWTHYLLGKKILIISPFIDSFQKQLKNGFKMFKDVEDGSSNMSKNIFLEGQEFVFYKSFNTLAGNHIHNNWYETYKIMCDDIQKLDFDIALLSCGGYGMPLCNFIKNNLKKSAIYVGGGLQLLFGVIGQRWLTHPVILKIIEENQPKFIRPSGDEIVINNDIVELGCYW